MPYITKPDRIEYVENDLVLAQVDFPCASDGVADICHTYVDASLRGRGVAGELVKRCAEELRASNKKADVTCSYAVKWFGEHPEYTDVLTGS